MEEMEDYYNFHESYEEDWEQFFAQFPSNDSTALEIKDCCLAIYSLIQTLHTSDPGYQVQFEIYLKWKTLERGLQEKHPFAPIALKWFASQIRNMIVGSDSEVSESIWYALSVNYFECGMDGYWLFPILYASLPEDEQAQLIEHSISIDWEGKVNTYRQIVQQKPQHEILAEAIYNSCSAYCIGAINPSEALPILEQLEISPNLRERTFKILTSPVEVEVKEVVHLSKPNEGGVQCFVALVPKEGFIPTWFPYCNFWINDTQLSKVEDSEYSLHWDDLARQYNFPLSESVGKIIGLNVPFREEWKDEKAWLKPNP